MMLFTAAPMARTTHRVQSIRSGLAFVFWPLPRDSRAVASRCVGFVRVFMFTFLPNINSFALDGSLVVISSLWNIDYAYSLVYMCYMWPTCGDVDVF
jgi:hypothetical protein